MSFGGCLYGGRASPVVSGSGVLLLVFHRTSLFMACWVCVGFDVWCVLCLVLFLFVRSCVALAVCSLAILLPLFLHLTRFRVTGHLVSIFLRVVILLAGCWGTVGSRVSLDRLRRGFVSS
jgi:hypothetical protein